MSTKIAEKNLTLLKSDNRTKQEVLFLVKHHDAPPETDKEQIAKKLRRYGEKRLRDLIILRRADNLAQSTQYHRTEIHDHCDQWFDELLNEQARCLTLKSLAINGNDLINEGFTPGPKIGQTLDTLLTAVSEGKLENSREVLLNYAKNIV